MLRNLWHISKKLTDTNLRIQIVQACILSLIDYSNSLYINLPNKLINRFQMLVNSSIRFIYRLPRQNSEGDYISITAHAQKCHFLPVQARIHFKICLLTHKCINNNAPPYLKELLTPKDSLSSLRINNDKFLLFQPFPGITKYKERRFSIAAPQKWNILPYEIRSSTSTCTFIKLLKSYFFLNTTMCDLYIIFFSFLSTFHCIVIH